MATPGQLVQSTASILGLSAATVTQFDRQLAEAGLRSKHGRGTSAAAVTADDAANLLISILAAPVAGRAIKQAASTCTAYGSLPSHPRSAHNPIKFANFGLRSLSELPAEHRLQEALSRLIYAASKGELLFWPWPKKYAQQLQWSKDLAQAIESQGGAKKKRFTQARQFTVDMAFQVQLMGPIPLAAIRLGDPFADEPGTTAASLFYRRSLRDRPPGPVGDLRQRRNISFATIRALGSLLGGGQNA